MGTGSMITDDEMRAAYEQATSRGLVSTRDQFQGLMSICWKLLHDMAVAERDEARAALLAVCDEVGVWRDTPDPNTKLFLLNCERIAFDGLVRKDAS